MNGFAWRLVWTQGNSELAYWAVYFSVQSNLCSAVTLRERLSDHLIQGDHLIQVARKTFQIQSVLKRHLTSNKKHSFSAF